eukprot:14701907-Ditylum_brightwellii.AAC.1
MMHRSGDPSICPVQAWAETVCCICQLPNFSQTTTVNIVVHSSTTQPIISTEILDYIRAAVTCMGKDELGFTVADVGTHSNWSAAVMSMYLAQVP